MGAARDWHHERDEPDDAFLHRATYIPDPRLVLDWGQYADDATLDFMPAWASPHWKHVVAQWARVLLDGAEVMHIKYAYIDRGAGADGYLPWLVEDRDPVPGDPSNTRRIGWSTMRWEVSFAALLNKLQGNAWDFDVDREMR